MTARGRRPEPGMMRHGPPPGVGASSGLHHLGSLTPELAEKEVIAQVAEIDHILLENRRLASLHITLREDLHGVHEEIHRLKVHIRSTQTESDIQIRVLLDKIAKMESDIKAGESLKKDLEQAHKEAQALVAARQELTLKIQQASQELEKCHTDVKKIPDMLTELDSMRLEHQRLRTTFEHEKRVNLDLVEHMQAMDKNLVNTMKEIEGLRAEVVNVEKRAQAPYGGAYPTSSPQYPSPMPGNAPYYDNPYARPPPQMGGGASMEGMLPHNTINAPLHTVGFVGGPPASGASASMGWGGNYDPNITGM